MTVASPFLLAGVRVLDLSQAVSGPFAGRIFADLGADVVKVEIEGGDILHHFGPRLGGGHTGFYLHMNAGKRNISVDLRAEGAAELIRRLAASCDVVIENFRPGTVDRLGVGWEALSAANPRLVMLSISGFGQWGPEIGRRAFAPVIHAESGLLGRQAQVDERPPTDVAMAAADSIAALHGAVAVLAALRGAERTGVGQHIDLGMLEAVLAGDDYVQYSLDGTQDQIRLTRGNIYDAVGGPVLISSDTKYLWVQLKRLAGLRDPDPEAGSEAKFAAREELIRTWVRSFDDRTALIAALEEANLAWADVRTPETLVDSPTVQARQVSADVDDRAGGTRPVIRTPYRFSAARNQPRGGAAFVGEHNAEVLAEWLDLGSDEVAALVDAGTLRSSPRPAPPG